MQGAEELIATSYNDVIQVLNAPGTVITGGAGNDEFHFSPGTLITDANGDDKVAMFGYSFDSAVGSGNSESPWAYTQGGLVKVGANSVGEMVIASAHYKTSENSSDGESASYMYLANGNFDPFADSADLTAGIRVADIYWDTYRIMEIPDGITLADNLGAWDFLVLIVQDFLADDAPGDDGSGGGGGSGSDGSGGSGSGSGGSGGSGSGSGGSGGSGEIGRAHV